MSQATIGGGLENVFLRLAEYYGVAEDRMATIVNSGVLGDVFHPRAVHRRHTIRTALGLGRTNSTTPGIFILPVNFGPPERRRTIKEMVEQGHYDWIDPSINDEIFPVSETGEIIRGRVIYEGRLFGFGDERVFYDEVKHHIRRAEPEHPWSPAKIWHLLSYGNLFPEIQRIHPIVGLGSTWKVRDVYRTPILNQYESKRVLALGWGSLLGWSTSNLFLAVRRRKEKADQTGGVV